MHSFLSLRKLVCTLNGLSSQNFSQNDFLFCFCLNWLSWILWKNEQNKSQFHKDKGRIQRSSTRDWPLQHTASESTVVLRLQPASCAETAPLWPTGRVSRQKRNMLKIWNTTKTSLHVCVASPQILNCPYCTFLNEIHPQYPWQASSSPQGTASHLCTNVHGICHLYLQLLSLLMFPRLDSI